MATVSTVHGLLASYSRRALAAGVIGLTASLAGFFLSREQFFRSYLLAYLFWGGLGFGLLAVLLLHNVTGGNWGVGIRRLLEAGAGTVPLIALMFVPVLLGLRELYIWARPEVVAHDPVLLEKRAYLNVPFLLVRTVAYFALWYFVSARASALSIRQDRENSDAVARKLRALSGPGLIFFILSMTFASVDWIMSLDPHWFSTIFGLLIVTEQGLLAFAFVTLVAIHLAPHKPLSDSLTKGSLYDLGNLLFALTLFWAYLAFSQFLIIWAGNLPEEIPWYLKRIHGGWQVVALAIIFLHFVLPFLMLMYRGTKRNPALLARVALLLVVIRFVETLWVVAPAGDAPGSFRVSWLDLAVPVGLGGIWLAVFFNILKGRWDVPALNRHRSIVTENEPA